MPITKPSIQLKLELSKEELDVRVGVQRFGGTDRLDVRTWWEPHPGEEAPTKKGVQIPIEDTLVLIDGILKVYAESGRGAYKIVPIEPSAG